MGKVTGPPCPQTTLKGMYFRPLMINTHAGRCQGASLVAQLVKSLPAMQGTRVPSLGQEDPPEREMAATPGFLPGESRGQRSLAGYSSRGRRSQTGGPA